jgi:hypothetical protein
MYYLIINNETYETAGDMIPLMEMGLEYIGFIDGNERMEIWNDKQMLMRLAKEHELQGEEEWRWLPGLRAIK